MEQQNLIQRKQELIVKLDSKSNYKSDEEYKKDEIELGEIELKILENIKTKIQNYTSTIPKEVTKEFQLETLGDIRKLRKEKREQYRQLTKNCYDLYQLLIGKKKLGVELELKLQSKNLKKYDLKKTISEVRRY